MYSLKFHHRRNVYWKCNACRHAGLPNVLLRQNQPTPHTTPPFIMRKHSARTSENLGLLINITVVHYSNARAFAVAHVCTLSAAPSGASANSSRDLGKTDFGYIAILPFAASRFPPAKRDIHTSRRNVRVITINLYDRFTSHRVLRADLARQTRTRRRFLSVSLRARFVSTRMIRTGGRIRAIVPSR